MKIQVKKKKDHASFIVVNGLEGAEVRRLLQQNRQEIDEGSDNGNRRKVNGTER